MREKREKVIFHMDGDSFFVACEVAKNEKLRGLPVVTGEERGIVSAASYEAKALGVTRGYPIFKLKKDFPGVLVLPGDYKSYADYSQKMFDIVRRYADEVEEYSIDECFADLTGLDKPLYMAYKQIAERIKKEVTEELRLSVSVGLAPTKCLAKVASKWQKPNGLTVITKETAINFLEKNPVGKIWGIGPRTSRELEFKGIKTALDFVNLKEDWIKENLSEPFLAIWHELQGVNVMQVDSETKTSFDSIQKTRTFHPPTSDESFLMSQFSKNIEEACRKARHYGLVTKRINFFLKTQDFHYHSFELPIETPTNAPEVLITLVYKYFRKVYFRMKVYRTTGVTLCDLTPQPLRQLDLFGEGDTARRFEKIHESIDNLEEKFGKKVVYLASTHKAKTRQVKGTDSEDLDRDLLFL
ncbi:MAG: DNA polymerase IV [Minisyncoccia bacterium]